MSSYSLLVNPSHPLLPDFVPRDLVAANIPFDAPLGSQKRLLRKRAAEAAEELFERACALNLKLVAVSGYRSYKRQIQLQSGSSQVALPGASEHQTGLALDVSCPRVSLQLTEDFADTEEGRFLKDYAPLYGFIVRYPKGREHITGYPWEPWHIRYVTKALSLYLALTGMTLEEFHNI